MKWIKAELSSVKSEAWYLVYDNDDGWRDFHLHVLSGYRVAYNLRPGIILGRPLWIAEITDPCGEAPQSATK